MAINFQSDTVGELILLIVALVIKDVADVVVSWVTRAKSTPTSPEITPRTS